MSKKKSGGGSRDVVPRGKMEELPKIQRYYYFKTTFFFRIEEQGVKKKKHNETLNCKMFGRRPSCKHSRCDRCKSREYEIQKKSSEGRNLYVRRLFFDRIQKIVSERISIHAIYNLSLRIILSLSLSLSTCI